MPARIKVYVPTYRRPHLLPRALVSLRAQTFGDWIAEVRNDDPLDPTPEAVVASLGDPRIRCVNHPQNLGAAATFNLCYGPGPEPFMALLEDDNAWEPNFLNTLLTAIESYPQASLVWCNQAIDEELADGSVRPTGRMVHPAPPNGFAPGLHPFGAPSQAFGALHANGAMLLRRSVGDEFRTPPIVFTGIEAYRERLLTGPILYLPEPLGRFTLTRQTTRENDTQAWAVFQTALVASFARAACGREAELWAHARASHPPSTNLLLSAAFADRGCRRLWQEAQAIDIFRWLAAALRRPKLARAVHRFLREPWWPLLAQVTAQRFAR